MTGNEDQEMVTAESEEVIDKILDQAVDALLERNISHVDICAVLVSYGASMSLELAPSTELAYAVILTSLLDQTKQKLAMAPNEDNQEFPDQNAPSTRTVQ